MTRRRSLRLVAPTAVLDACLRAKYATIQVPPFCTLSPARCYARAGRLRCDADRPIVRSPECCRHDWWQPLHKCAQRDRRRHHWHHAARLRRLSASRRWTSLRRLSNTILFAYDPPIVTTIVPSNPDANGQTIQLLGASSVIIEGASDQAAYCTVLRSSCRPQLRRDESRTSTFSSTTYRARRLRRSTSGKALVERPARNMHDGARRRRPQEHNHPRCK